MHQAARHNAILERLSRNGSCTVAELVAALGVSDETVRRDIKTLAWRGLVERVHGGVMLPAPVLQPGFDNRLNQNALAKQVIAQLVVEQIRDGDSVMFDTGSTTLYAARALRRHSNLFAVTNCVDIARALANESNGNRVHLAGGQYRADDSATFGDSAIHFVSRFRARQAIISADAVDLDGGLLNYHLADAEFCQAIIANAAHVIVVVDHSKFGSQAPVRVCGFERVATLVTDAEPPAVFRRRLEEAEVRLLVPEDSAQADRSSAE